MAFVRCLTPDVVQALATDASFAPQRVAGHGASLILSNESGSIHYSGPCCRDARGEGRCRRYSWWTAQRAGSWDGRYLQRCAARWMSPNTFHGGAAAWHARGNATIVQQHRAACGELAVKKARGPTFTALTSRCVEFDFHCRVASGKQASCGEYLQSARPLARPSVGGIARMMAWMSHRLFVERLAGERRCRASLLAQADRSA